MAGFTTIYHYDNGDEFPVAWADQKLAAQPYWWNAQHTPFACTPLSTDYLSNVWSRNGIRDFVYFSGGESIDSIVHPDGYMYVPMRPATPPSAVAPHIQEIRDRFTSQAPTLRQSWEAEHEPLLQKSCRAIKSSTFPSMTLPEMAARLRELFDLAADRYNMTMTTAGPMMIPHLQLQAFCQAEFNEDASVLVEALEGGFANSTTSAGAQLWKLAQIARVNPDLMKLIESASDADILKAIAASPDAEEFSSALAKYLEQYGSRTEFWFELSAPTQGEDPHRVMEQIRQVLISDEPDPQLATAKSARIRRVTAQRLSERLRSDPQKLGVFNRVIVNARQYVPIKESRAFWQMTISGSIRQPCLVAGQMLADAEVLESPKDIFYLHMNEIDVLTAAPHPSKWKELVATRRAEHATRVSTNPPAFIGGKYEAAASQPIVETAILAAGEVLTGLPASAGTVEGRAVVVRTLQEAGKLETGDILICNSTSPAWSMLFSRIAAVVTTGGGPLSHTAIVAREYKVPCVLNVEGVTSRVQDGMRIKVDGTAGTVELVD